MRKFPKVHYVKVRIVFDKPIRQRDAVKQYANSCWGEFYTDLPEDEAQKFNIRGVTSAAKRR